MNSDQRNTLRGAPVVTAPGKIFLIGEYAVLEGGPAVVAAVNRQVVGQFVPGMDPESPVVAEAVRATLEGIGDRAAALPAGSVLLDSSGFSQAGRKLGLGSSAAVAAAAVGAVLEMAGLPISAHRDLCFGLADQAHRAAQNGVGSGADVAAAVHGGVIQFRRPPGGYPVIDKMRPPPDLHVVVFAEDTAANTADMIGAMKAFASQKAKEYHAILGPMREQAELFVEALVAQRVGALIEHTQAYATALDELGRAAGIPIVTPRTELAADLAINLEGAAKPAGAGGGDVGVALFGNAEAAQTFTTRAAQLGLSVIDAGWAQAGVARRLPSH